LDQKNIELAKINSTLKQTLHDSSATVRESVGSLLNELLTNNKLVSTLNDISSNLRLLTTESKNIEHRTDRTDRGDREISPSLERYKYSHLSPNNFNINSKNTKEKEKDNIYKTKIDENANVNANANANGYQTERDNTKTNHSN